MAQLSEIVLDVERETKAPFNSFAGIVKSSHQYSFPEALLFDVFIFFRVLFYLVLCRVPSLAHIAPSEYE
jgi:hypothetical protein